MLHVVIVATEPSGDALGAGLIAALKQRFADIHFSGIGGPKMQALGFLSLVPMERLSVMGFIEPLKRLPELLSIRHKIIQHSLNLRPNVYIGIDGPDFNLPIEKKLKQQKLNTVHYVSPTIWAWRPKRIHKIKQATNHNLLIFPFEKAIYEQHNVPATYVGHPLADRLPLEVDTLAARLALGLSDDDTVFALLPGSRGAELKNHLPIAFETAEILQKNYPDAKFILPYANEQRRQQVKDMISTMQVTLPLIYTSDATLALSAANASMVCSGTATLQALLCKKPFVIFYKTHPFTFWLAKKLVKTKYIGMANIIADQLLAKEFVQNDAQPELIADALSALIHAPREDHLKKCVDLHARLKQNTDQRAAQSVAQYLC